MPTAVQVYGARRIERRLTDIQRRISPEAMRGRGDAFRRALRALLRQVLRRVPVITGRLYRSMRVRMVDARTLAVRFTAPYAKYPEERSKKNRRYFARGIDAGLRAARTAGLSGGVRVRFRRHGRVHPYGRGGLVMLIRVTII